MHPTDQTPLDFYFKEGLKARQDGKALHDNPYAAGSANRREWRAGFCATVAEDEDPALEPVESDDLRPSD